VRGPLWNEYLQYKEYDHSWVNHHKLDIFLFAEKLPLFFTSFPSNSKDFALWVLSPLRTSHPLSIPNGNEKEPPHTEKSLKKERFSPLFSIFGRPPKMEKSGENRWFFVVFSVCGGSFSFKLGRKEG
jgi:hypothetical protein